MKFKDKIFEKEVILQASKTSAEIFPMEYHCKKVWVKKARRTESSLTHKLYYKLFPLKILLPVEKKNKEQSVLFETNKLMYFKQLGINTPFVIERNNELFVLEDCGKNVNSFIRKRDITQKKMYYFVDKMIEILASIHNHKEYHGGPQARNFTYKDGIVSVIDCEESFNEQSIEILQYRDLFLFLLSLTKTRASFELDYKVIIELYMHKTNNIQIVQSLKRLCKKLSPILILLKWSFIYRFLGKDVKQVLKLFDTLKSL